MATIAAFNRYCQGHDSVVVSFDCWLVHALPVTSADSLLFNASDLAQIVLMKGRGAAAMFACLSGKEQAWHIC